MKKFLAIVAVGLALAGCAKVEQAWNVATSASVPAQYAYAAANSFDAIEAAATAYIQLPLCGSQGASVACRNATATAKIVPAVRSGRAARNQIEALLGQNSGAAIPVATYNTLEAAINTLQAIDAQYNISATK